MKKANFFGLCLAVVWLFFIKATRGEDLLVSGEFTNNGLNVVVSAPGGFTNRVEIYACSNLASGTWNVAAENLRPVGGVPAKWHTAAGKTGFFVAGNMDIDSDGDGVPDAREQFVHKTSSVRWDSDGDWMPDGWEMTNSLNALTSDGGADADGDGLSNRDEYQRGSDPHNADTDGDGLSDGEEVLAGTDPLQVDTDGDGLPDGWEVRFGYDPVNKAGALSSADQIGQFDTDGTALAVEVRGDIAYVADGTNGLVILDVRHPGGRKLGSLSLEGEANVLLLTNNTIWVALGSNGVAAVDVSDPFRPRKLGFYYTDGWTGGLALQSNLLYIANTAKDLPILDVQRLDDIVQVGLYNDYFSGGYGVCVKGTNAWLALSDRLVQLNISNPSNPAYISNAALYSFPHDMQITSNRLYVTTDDNLQIWNQNLGVIKRSSTSGVACGFGMESNRVLVAEGVNFAELIDISNETAPAVIANMVVSGFVNGAALCGERGYLAAGEGGLIVIRFSTDADGDGVDDNWEIRYFGNLSQTATNDFDGDGILNREEFMIGSNPTSTDSDADGLSDHNEIWVYGSDPTRADSDLDGLSDYIEVNTYHTNPAKEDTDGEGMPDGWEILNGFYPLIADGIGDADSDGLSNADEYLNHTDPHNADSDGDTLSDGWEAFHGMSNSHTNYPLRASLEQVAVRDTPGEARSVFVKDGWLYAADGTNGLVIFDLSIPSAPVLTATLDTAGFAYDVVVSNRYAYIADGINGLVIVSVSNPASPVIVGHTNTLGNAEGIAVQSNYVYLADGSNNLVTINVSNKALPKVTSDAFYTDNLHDVFVQGKSLYAALWQNAWRFDLADPAVPVTKAAAGFAGWDVIGIHGNGSVIVAVAGVNGVKIMNDTSMNARTVLGSYDTDGTASGVFVSSNYAYIADGPGGLTILNISTPSAPVMKYKQDTAGMAYGVFPNGEYVYVADGSNGVVVFRLVEDSDGDGMSDFWERAYFGNLSQTATNDFDGDGIRNWAEYRIAGNPCTNDADGDLLSDYAEIWTYHTQPLSRDTDFDGRDDRSEIFALGGVATDPLNSDCDNDGLRDGAEIAAGSNPHIADTDGDGMPDGWEVANGLSPTVANAFSDPDGDGLNNITEYQRGSKANVPDTDNDGLNDGAEVAAGTGLLSVDSDGDGLSDGAEVHTYSTNPLSPDSDGDGMPDGWEVTNGLSPTMANASSDADSDGLNNLAEYQHGSRANTTDSDNDGLSDYYEVTHGLNPANGDSDGDGLPDNSDKQPGQFEVMLPAAVTNVLGWQTNRYINLYPTPPIYEGTYVFIPSNLPPTNVAINITNVAIYGTVSDSFKINNVPYYWRPHAGYTDQRGFGYDITTNVAPTLGGTNTVGFSMDIYSWTEGTTRYYPGIAGYCRIQFQKAVPLDLVPDYDRNGSIDTNDLNRLHAGEPFRFWVNDDDDSGYDGGQDIPGAGSPLNYSDSQVNGVRDLIDFFPVYLSLSNLVAELPPSAPPGEPYYIYKLSHAESALNIVQTTLSATNAGAYLRNVSAATSLGNATVQPVTSAGWQIPSNFVDSIRTGNKGIILIEARAPTTKPLVLKVYDTSNTLVAERELPLSITGVEQMFRHKNLRADISAGGEGSVADRDTAPNWPDSLCSTTNLFFLHGFDIDELAARGWHAEMFKRLYWSGSKARFHGITWYGDKGSSANYQENVNHALRTALYLKNYVSSVSGAKIMLAHSLGNMVVSRAIEDYGMSVQKYLMLDAAVPSEAYDASLFNDSANNNPMLPEDWAAYYPRTWSANFHNLYSSPDKRAELTWRGRFASVVPFAYNFYSSEDEVFELHPSVNFLSGFDRNFTLRRYTWQKQEVFKGCDSALLPGSVGSTKWWGWGFDSSLESAGHANGLSTNELKRSPVFRHNPDWYNVTNLDSIAVNQMLAMGLPAMSPSAGQMNVARFNPVGQPPRNINISTLKENGWPRTGGTFPNRWLHNDCREVAYLYTRQLFEQLVEEGGLK